MFVSNLKKVLGLTASTVFISLVGATTAFADESADAEWNIIPGNIPVTVTITNIDPCLLYTSPSPRDLSTSRMPSSA